MYVEIVEIKYFSSLFSQKSDKHIHKQKCIGLDLQKVEFDLQTNN